MARARTATDTQQGTRTLFLVRHAIAEERGSDYPDDAVRPLTKKGIARMREVVRGFASLDPELEMVLTSPLVRARHTARILRTGASPVPQLAVVDALAPGHSPADVAAALAPYAAHRVLALVGHEPDLGALAAWLIGAREPLVFRKGGIARIDVQAWPPDRRGSLQWFATPRMLRSLGK